MDGTQLRMTALDILTEITQEGEYSHIALRQALSRLAYLPKQERAFINRLVDGTVEYLIRLDYVLDQFSSVKTEKMKPVIRNILRLGAYQLLFMDSVPDSAACNEAVRMAQKKGFYSLKGFVNGVMRTVARRRDAIAYPPRGEDEAYYLSICYSMPLPIVNRWIAEYGGETTEKMLAAFMEERPTTVRFQQYRMDPELTINSLRRQGVTVKKAPYLPYAWYLSDYDSLAGLKSFVMGRFVVQDLSSMLVAEVADPKKGDHVIDLCAAPGGKSLHIADKMQGYGDVEARDLTEYKVSLIEENIRRTDTINMTAVRRDATVVDRGAAGTADIVLADIPCSGLGVIGRKNDIKYRADADRIRDLVILQRQILHNAAQCVKPGGVLVYSTCTITREENQENRQWFLEEYPFEAESLDPFLPEELRCETTREGYLQLLPGVTPCDGFFIAKFRRKREDGNGDNSAAENG